MKLHRDEEAFFALLPLLRHGAIEADGAPGLDAALAVGLHSAFGDPHVTGFVADAQRLVDDMRVAIRNRRVRLLTENPLTAGFIPPGPGQVIPTLETALRALDAALATGCNDAEKAVCAVIGMQVLLTIHPFRDGNGRTARLFLAAQVLRHVGPTPSVLLGMLLMHRSGAHQYHQASWALRAGDPAPMVGLFAASERLAADCLLQGSAACRSPAGLLEHCWMELRALR